MGYGIHVTGTAHRAGLFGFGAKPAKTLQSIQKAIDATVVEPIHRRFLDCQMTKDVLFVKLHPATEDMEISVKGSEILVSAKTSTAGPGYHAYLIDVLDSVSRLAGIDFDWTNGEEAGDETGYHEHRDIELLRDESVCWLRAIRDQIVNAAAETNRFQVNMPIGFDSVASDYFAMTPMGEFSREWFEEFPLSDDNAAKAMAEQIFPAWQGRDHASYWLNIARYLMLWDVEWTVPVDQRQRKRYENVIACVEYARPLDPMLEAPETELEELRGLLESGESSAPPQSKGIGFRRGLMQRQLGGNWDGHIPGYFYIGTQTHDGGNSHRFYWFGEREIHFSAVIFNSDDDEITAASMVGRFAITEGDSEKFDFMPAVEWVDAAATSNRSEDYTTVQAGFGISRGSGHEVLMLTIIHENDEDGARWARELLESVSCPSPDAN